jgi:integrase
MRLDNETMPLSPKGSFVHRGDGPSARAAAPWRHYFLRQEACTQLSDMSLTAALRRMGRGDITIHGFRSTFRDWCAESLGNSFPRDVCEHALAHSLPDRVEAAYRRGDLLEKRLMLMQAWADYCMATTLAPIHS